MRSGTVSRADPVVVGLGGIVAVLGLLLHGAIGPPSTYWTIDNGGKALVLANLAEDPGRTWIRYPGESLDPRLRHFPQPLTGPEPYAGVRQGRVVSQYQSPFVYLTLPLWIVFGFAGQGVLPALGGGAAVLLTGLLAARRAGARAGRAAATILALATPLLFYSSVFWEHTVATALAAGVFLALAPNGRCRPLLAGVLGGGACLLREEAVLLVAGTGLALGIAGRGSRCVRRFLGGGAIGIGALLAFQEVTTGSWIGIHLGVNRPVPFLHLGRAAEGLLFGTGFSGTTLGGGVAVLGILAVAAYLASRRPRRPGPSPTGERSAGESPRGGGLLFATGVLALGAISGAALIRFPGGEDEALALLHSNSALVFLPWALAVPFLPRRPEPAGALPAGRDFLAWAPLLFVALFLLLVPERSITGVHPGPRMLLPVLPALAVLAAERFPRDRLIAAALLLTLACGGAAGALSLRILHDKREAAGRLAEAIASDPRRIVATDLFWLPTELSALWDRKQFHLVTGPASLADLARAAAGAGERELLLVTAPGSVAGEPVRTVRPARLPAFAADLHVQPLKDAPPAVPPEPTTPVDPAPPGGGQR